MKRATGEERALARATMYRLLSLSFSYPTPDLFAALAPALQVGEVGADLLGEGTGRAATRMTSRLAETDLNGPGSRTCACSRSATRRTVLHTRPRSAPATSSSRPDTRRTSPGSIGHSGSIPAATGPTISRWSWVLLPPRLARVAGS